MSRYEISGRQNTCQAGSGGEVLQNKLGIVKREAMDQAELVLLRKLYEAVLQDHLPCGPITVHLIQDWHRHWLGNVYPWAGQERSVNMSKDGFPFAAASRISALLRDYERQFLLPCTPCFKMNREELTDAIAITHAEFILIHPFREGNGRISRLLADVMAVQAGLGPLDYSAWESGRPQYIQAIQAALGGNYAPMRACVGQVLAV